MTSLCSQSNPTYHLHSICIVHPPLNTMNYDKSKFVAKFGEAGYQ